MRFICGVLFLISFAASLPIDSKSLPEKNPCTLEALYSVRYFHPYPSDETKYIRCDPWGSMRVETCPEGSKWDKMMMDCMFMNRTVDGPVLDMDELRQNETWLMNNFTSNKYCSLYGNHSCQNGGICGYDLKCLCFSNTTGDFCEISKPSAGVFGKLINDSFSLEEYKKGQLFVMNIMGLNDSFDYNRTLFDKSLMDNMTIENVNKYFAMFANGTMRFDTLLNLLVEDFLSFIFPDAFFLREFSMPTEVQMGFANAIPRLLSVTKYSYDRFDSMFAMYEEILLKLSKYLVEKDTKVKAESKSFYEIYHLLNEKLDRLYNFTEVMDVKPMEKGKEITREMLVKKLCKDFERTLNQSYELFEMLTTLDNELSWRHQLYNISLQEIEMTINNFTSSPMVLDRINRLLYKNTEIWDILSFYGFSHVLSELTSIPIFESSVVQTTFQALMADNEDEDRKNEDDERDRIEREFEENDDSEDFSTTRRESRQATTVRPQALVNDRFENQFDQKKSKVMNLREESWTTVRPQALVGETTSKKVREESWTTVRPQALVDETTPKKIREESWTTVRPQALVGETTVRPQALVGETTVKKIREESWTTVRPQALVGETTVRPQALVGETTVRPQALVGETTSKKVREELTTVRPQALVGETTVRPQALVGETTSKKVREELTTVRPQALVGETTLKKIREDFTTVRPQALVGETTAKKVREELTTVRPQALVGETTVKKIREEFTTVRPQALVDETTVKPRAEESD